MNTLSIENLSVILNIDKNDLFVKATAIDRKYSLGITDFTNLDRVHYDIIRANYDTGYLVSIISGEPTDRKYNYTKSPVYRDLVTWLSDYNLNEFSTADIKGTLPDHLKGCGIQTVAAAMRNMGYESKMVYLKKGSKKQGRRWFKYITDETPSFL